MHSCLASKAGARHACVAPARAFWGARASQITLGPVCCVATDAGR